MKSDKYQEAISNYFTAKLKFDNEMYKAMDLLEELADKSTPIKPIENILGTGKYLITYTHECSKCGNYLEVSNKYCSECGTELDWSDENE